jgi:hypothetical protein
MIQPVLQVAIAKRRTNSSAGHAYSFSPSVSAFANVEVRGERAWWVDDDSGAKAGESYVLRYRSAQICLDLLQAGMRRRGP